MMKKKIITLFFFYLRKCKKIFFRILVRHPSLQYQKVLHLTEVVLNSTPSRAIYNYKPHRAHFDNFISCKILRQNLEAYRKNQEEAKSVFERLDNDKILKIGDKVRLKLTKQIIRKESGLYNPLVSKEVFEIIDINSDRFPKSYRLKELPGHRLFYAWNLVKVDERIIQEAEKQKKHLILQDDEISTISVLDIKIRESNMLRSNKILPSKSEIMYIILHKGEKQFVTKETLLLFKKMFNDDVLKFSAKFYTPEFQQYRV